MSTKQTEALKLALEALESSQQYVEACANAKTKAGWGEQLDLAGNAITAIKEALAEQPAQPQGLMSKQLEAQYDTEWEQRWPNAVTSPPASKPCAWQQEDSEHMPDTWRSDCGVLWTFTDGGPVENDMKHCCGCGAKLREKNA